MSKINTIANRIKTKYSRQLISAMHNARNIG